MDTYVHLWSYLAELFWKWEICRTKFVENIILLRSITYVSQGKLARLHMQIDLLWLYLQIAVHAQ
jgi:hypothetical protein